MKHYHFNPAAISATQGVNEIIQDNEMHFRVMRCLGKHVNGQWENEDEHDTKVNQQAVKHGGRVLTAWEIDEHKLFIITDGIKAGGMAGEWTNTVIMLRSEY